MKNSHCIPLRRVFRLTFFALAVLVELSVASMAQESSSLDDLERQKIVQEILDVSGGGTQANKMWQLNSHWVGDLEVIVTTGAYNKGGI